MTVLRVFGFMRCVGLVLIIGCTFSFAQSAAPSKYRFEVASVKPSAAQDDNSDTSVNPAHVQFRNVPLLRIILISFGLRSESQLQGLPEWARTERFDIDAKADEETSAMLPKLTRDERREMPQQMMQALLAERFQMRTRWGKKELPVYALSLAKGSSKLTPSATPPRDAGSPAPPGQPPNSISMMHGRLEVTNGTMAVLANVLSGIPDLDNTIVVDKTALTGIFDFTLEWTPEATRNPLRGTDSNASTAEMTKPAIFTALTEQLGLRLTREKGPVDLLIVDKLERPSEN